MSKDPVPQELRAAEREVDRQYLENPLTHEPFARAGWYFLAFCEEIAIREVVRQDAQTKHEYAAFADNLIVHAKWPLKWLWQTCPVGGEIPRGFDGHLYEAASRLSQLSLDYVNFESAFTYATFDLITLALDGNRIRTSGPMRNDSRFDAYDRFMLPPHMPSADPSALSFIDRVGASVRVHGGRFSYDLNPRIVRNGLESLGQFIDGQFSLPSNWSLPRFTIEQFGRVARVLWVLAIIHFNARTTAALNGCQNLGFSSALMLMDRDEIIQRLRRYSGVDERAVAAIVEDLTYGARGQANPDPALQPIVPLTASTVAISPSLILHSSMERNLSVLLNRFPEERGTYTTLSQEKEVTSRKRLTEGFSGMGFRFWHGQVKEWGGASDVDFAIISDVEKRCLILELKSFIAPAEPREIRDRSSEIGDGIEQIRRRMQMAEILSAPFYALMRIDDHYKLSWAVASESSIGACYVQSPDVPVINTRHLIAKLRQNPSLATCCCWLEGREYLPTAGLHYKEVETETNIGKWILEWYGIKDLVDEYI
jgi:hypothetical protein